MVKIKIQISMHSYIVSGLKPNTKYTFIVMLVDNSGKESSNSNEFMQSTSPTSKIFDVTK